MRLVVLLTFIGVLSAATAAYPQSIFEYLTWLTRFHSRTPTPLELEMQQRHTACNCDAIGYIIITYVEDEDGTSDEEPEYSEIPTFVSSDEEESDMPNEITPEDAYMYEILNEKTNEFRRKREDQDWQLKNTDNKRPCCGHRNGRDLTSAKADSEKQEVDSLEMNRMKREVAEPDNLKKRKTMPCCGNRKRREAGELKSLCCRQLKELEGKINIRVPRECKQETDNCCGHLDEPDCCRGLNKREAVPCCGNRKKRGIDIGTKDEENNDSTEDTQDNDYAGVNEDEPKRHPCKSFGNFTSIGLPFRPIAFICIEDYEGLGVCRDGVDVNCCNLSGELRKKCFMDEFLDMFSESILTLNEEMGRRGGRSMARSAGPHVPSLIAIYPAKSE